MNSAEELIAVDGLSVSYGKVEAVREASLRVAAGGVVTIIGPNGAGKTTLLAALMGMLPSRGTIAYFGQVEHRPVPTEALVRRGLCLVPERRELFSTMTVEDNLILGAYTRIRDGDRRYRTTLDEVYALFPRLKERRTQKAGTLSGGESQMVAIGRGLMAAPRLLMLDEPSLGLAPLVVRETFLVIRKLRERGTCILLVEQNAAAALQVADYAYVMESGSLIAEGPAAELANQSKIRETYLGGRAVQAYEAGHPVPQK